jgi:hypothetical protein
VGITDLAYPIQGKQKIAEAEPERSPTIAPMATQKRTYFSKIIED